MTLGRRDIFGLGALGLGAVALDGCGGFFPWGRSAEQPDIEQLLRELDHVVLQMKSLDPDPHRFGIKKGGDFDRGRAESLRLLTTLCFMGTYRHVPEAVWREPNVEKRLAETLPQIHDTIRAARNHLVELSDEECARIDKKLHEEPELTMQIMERIDDYASQIRVPMEQRTYLRTAAAQLASRFRFEGSKEVTAKLTGKYDRTLRTRKSEIGFPADAEPDDTATEQSTPSQGLRVRFRTRASARDVRVAACGIEPRVTIDGVERRVVIDSEEHRCAIKPGDEPIHGTIRVDPAEAGENVVTIALDSADESLSANLTDIARHLQQVLAGATTTAKPPVRGSAGESCRAATDCEGHLECEDGTCVDPSKKPGSAKLIKTTGTVAKWGAILLIPPICAIGVLVLLVALFMVIVAGCMYAAGN